MEIIKIKLKKQIYHNYDKTFNLKIISKTSFSFFDHSFIFHFFYIF